MAGGEKREWELRQMLFSAMLCYAAELRIRIREIMEISHLLQISAQVNDQRV